MRDLRSMETTKPAVFETDLGKHLRALMELDGPAPEGFLRGFIFASCTKLFSELKVSNGISPQQVEVRQLARERLRLEIEKRPPMSAAETVKVGLAGLVEIYAQKIDEAPSLRHEYDGAEVLLDWLCQHPTGYDESVAQLILDHISL